MSEIFDNLKKIGEKISGRPAGAPESKGMEISDMKRQILEKLKEKRDAATSVVENVKPSVSREEILKAIKRPFGAPRPESRIIIKKDEELLKRYESLKAESDRKNAVVQDLERRLKEEKGRAAALSDTLKTKDESVSRVNKLHKELEEAKKITEAERARHANLQAEHKKVALSRDETAKLLKILRSEADVKERTIRDLQKKAARLNELEEMLRTKDSKAAEAANAYREEIDQKNAALQDLEKRVKEESSRAAVLAETLKSRDDKAVHADRLHKELEEAKRIAAAERVKHESLRTEHAKVSLSRDETAKLLKILRFEAEVKEKTIRDLQKKTTRLDELEEMLRVKNNKATEAAKVYKELEESKKLNDEYRAKIENMRAEKEQEAAGRDEKIKSELTRKDAFVLELQKKFATEIDEITKDRDRAALNVESLRSKLYAATKEIKEQGAKISQLEEAARSKDRRVLETEKLHAALDLAKNGTETKLRAAESDNKSLNEKYARANDELKSVMARLEDAEKSHKELEASYGGMSSELQAGLRSKKELEAKLEQAGIEMEAKTTRLAEADKLYKELDSSVRELTSKLQENQRHTKEVEASNEDLALRLSNANRDRKEFEARIAELASEIEAKTVRLAGADKLHGELEAIIKDTEAKLQASRQRVGDLEKETILLAESLKASDIKLKEVEDESKSEIEKLRAEIGPLKNTVMQKEKKELELKASIEQLEVEMQARDSKIEGDLKYTEKVIKEISELRKKVAALQRQSERTKSAGA